MKGGSAKAADRRRNELGSQVKWTPPQKKKERKFLGQEGGNLARHAQSRLKFQRDALFLQAGAHCRVVPKRDDVLTACLDHASRVLYFLLGVVSRGGRVASAVSAEERLPARTRAHAHLERALRCQQPRARVVRRDEAGKRLLDSFQRRQAHAQAAQVVGHVR